MSDMMTFPDTWEEFEKSYGFTDNEEVYTNGARLIPSFRVKQWLDHLLSVQPKLEKNSPKLDNENGELISRQGAKDAIDMALDRIDHVPSWVYDKLLNALNEVPSVKPTHETPPNTLGTLDCVSREDLTKRIKSYFGDLPIAVHYDMLALAQRLPAVQPRKGKWELCGNHHLCSECDEWAFTKWDEDECDEVDVLTDFCPNCGSYNGGEQDG